MPEWAIRGPWLAGIPADLGCSHVRSRGEREMESKSEGRSVNTEPSSVSQTHMWARIGQQGKQNPRDSSRERQQGDRRENCTDSQSRAEEIVSRSSLKLPALAPAALSLSGSRGPLAAARARRR